MTAADASAPPRTRFLRTRRGRLIVGLLAATAVLAPLGWYWSTSLIPSTYSVMDMGYVDYGGGPAEAGHGGHGGGSGTHAGHGAAATGGLSVEELTGPRDGTPDVTTTLTARQETVSPDGGESLDGYTLNGSSPGPEIRATQGDLVEVRLVNESVDAGVSLHWHGIDVPNAEDGVAGVTQDAVPVGGEHVYRFVVEDAGTYWYHSHQVSHEQVRDGLFGTFVVAPQGGAAQPETVAAVHTYEGFRTINGVVGESRVDAPPGAPFRVRVVNTDDAPMKVWTTGAPYRVVAVDGYDVNRPTEVTDQLVSVAAGGRVDLEIVMPADGSAVRVDVEGASTYLALGSADADVPDSEEPETELDLLTYGLPGTLPFEPSDADRQFEYRIGRRIGLLDGRPGFWWTINGHLYPDVPTYVVQEGDVVTMTITNDSGQVHPMHLHGHHVVVLSRNGEQASGSPWWTDTLDVEDGDSYVVGFVADNPGIWMDHCHNLPHATEGLVTHLAYAGVTSPYLVGGSHSNQPE